MVHDRAGRWLKLLGAASAIAAASMLVWFAAPAVYAQGFMRGPNLNIGPRVNPNIAGRVNANVGARVNPNVGVRVSGISPRIGVGLHPYARYSPNLYPLCKDVNGDAACWDQPGASADDAAAARRRGQDAAGRATAARSHRSTSAPSPIKSWPRSTARCRRHRPTIWRGVTAWRGCNRRISR